MILKQVLCAEAGLNRRICFILEIKNTTSLRVIIKLIESQ
jgi:hypothetical protein